MDDNQSTVISNMHQAAKDAKETLDNVEKSMVELYRNTDEKLYFYERTLDTLNDHIQTILDNLTSIMNGDN